MSNHYSPSSGKRLSFYESIESLPGNGGHILATEAFNPEVRAVSELADIAFALGEVAEPQARLSSADMFREIATHANEDDALGYEMEAQNRYKDLVEAYTIDGNPQHLVAIKALKQLTYAHTYGWHAINGWSMLPPDAIHRQTFGKMRMLGEIAAKKQYELSGDQRISFAGELGEISVLLLLQRAALKIGSTGYWPYPSLFSEDNTMRSSIKSCSVRNSWDISVLTQTDSANPPERSYALQVKTKRHARDHRNEYAQGISVIFLQDIVDKYRNDKEPLSVVVPRILEHEANDEDYAKVALDEMTDRLLDEIDR
jgi:hypothetical protein